MNCLAHQKKNAQPLDANLCLKKDAIFKLPRPHAGQVAIASDTNETYIYGKDGWQLFNDVKVEGKGLNMSLYNLNQSIIAQMHNIIDFTDSIMLINEFNETVKNKYYMLYAKDISYFTVFHMEKYGEFINLGDAVVECLNSIGKVKSIDYTANKDAIEIWIQQQEDEPICAYFFPYDTGIVTVEEI